MGFEAPAAAAARLKLFFMTTSDAAVRRTLLPLFPDVTMPNELGGNLYSNPGNRIRPSVRHAERSTREIDDARLAENIAPGTTPVSPVSTESDIPRFGHDLDALLLQLFATPQVASEMMAAASAQARALALVWEAHERGAIALPDPVARAVADARARVPRVCLPPLVMNG